MIELFEKNIKADAMQSSKGNQLKWFSGEAWYKADYAGYEGLAEYTISNLLRHSTLDSAEYIVYETDEIKYGHNKYLGCRSADFLPDGWQLITLERLFHNFHGESLSKSIYNIQDLSERLRFLVDQTERICGLKDFGIYMSKLLTIDTLFLNEDRHMHNIAVLLDEYGTYHYCPVFDNGAALLSDTTMDYPMGTEVNRLVDHVKAKTFCQDFDEQIDVAEQLYGQHIKFLFSKKQVFELLEQEKYYPQEVKTRVADIMMERMRRFKYLF